MSRLSRAVVLAVAIAATSARAATIEIDFDAHVVSVSPGVVGGSLAPGDSVHGHVVIDRDRPIDSDLAPDSGFYSAPNYPVLSFVLTIGGDYIVTTASPNSDNQIIVTDNTPTTVPPSDRFSARSPVTGDPVNGLSPLFAQFALFGVPTLGGEHLVGDDIPTVAELAELAIRSESNKWG